MQRRRFCAAVAGAAALAGCTTASRGGVDGNDPAAVLRAWYQAYYDEDTDGVEELTHPSGPLAEELAGGALVIDGDPDISVEDVEVVSRSDGRVVVSFTVRGTRFGDGEGTQTSTGRAELRRYQGEWHVWRGIES